MKMPTIALKSISSVVIASAMLLAVETASAIKPIPTYQATPATLSITYDSLNVPTSNGQRLTAWLCHPEKKQSDQLIVLAGPDAGNMANELQLVQQITKNLGIDVLLFDYRGFGTSDQIAIDSDLIALPEFAEDIHSVLRFVRIDLQRDSNQVVVYGRSMGASLAITVAERYGGLGGVVAESPYVTQHALKLHYDSVYKAMGSKRRIKTIRASILEPLASIQSLMCPILILHGSQEEQVTSSEINSLYWECGSKAKSLYLAAGAGHMAIPYKQTGVFLNMLSAFLGDSDVK